MALFRVPVGHFRSTLSVDRLKQHTRKLLAMHYNHPPLTALSGPDLLQLQYFQDGRRSSEWMEGFECHRVEEIIQQHLPDICQ